jgi:hypothetical protein
MIKGADCSDPSALFVIRGDFRHGVFSFALSGLLLSLSLLFVPPGTCGPVAFKTISPVIGPECHGILLSRG